MMSNNKILTVSYGTFSCTLEGFDDSFGTMKAIAEYFRGLSSDAPYFGAEPPQPDAEMLARIAQKEISRRVEARQHDGKIHLSAIENRFEEETTAPQALLSDEPENDVSADTTENDVIADKANVATSVEVDAAETQDTDEAPAPTDSVKADEAEVDVAEVEVNEAEVNVIAAPDLQTENETDEPKAEEAKEAVAEDEPVKEAAAPAIVKDEIDVVPGQPDADMEAFFANSSDDSTTEDEDQDLAAEQIAQQPDLKNTQNESIAAKLQRIRAVVAQHDEIDDEADFVEDQHAGNGEASQVEPDHLMANVRRDIEDALDANEAADTASEVLDEEDDDDITTILGRLDAADAAEKVEADEDIFASSEISDGSDDPNASDDALSNMFGGEESDVAEEEDAVATDSEHDAKAVDSPEDADKDDEPLTARARVIKVKRADLEAAIESGEIEGYGDDEDDEDDNPVPDDLAAAETAEISISAEDEADLARDLADVENDMSPAETSLSETLNDENEAEEAPEATAPRHGLPSIDDAKGDDIDRLLAETDHQMDEPESATRRSAFSHLRAAVAATKADLAMGASDDEAKDDDAYRNDLADVVRPRRPVSSTSRTDRPSEERPAPLKLVAEQRIDLDQPRSAGPVRPRRVAAIVDASPTAPDGDSFADYAAEMGATKLPQLLEAAAAYMSFVEGREQFSRPQLMTKVRQVSAEDGFSREEGLRSFGRLLRAGKIEKITGGRFTASDDIGYRPDHRAVS